VGDLGGGASGAAISAADAADAAALSDWAAALWAACCADAGDGL
jgi:hypothetical protein